MITGNEPAMPDYIDVNNMNGQGWVKQKFTGLTIRQQAIKDFMACMLSSSVDCNQGYQPFWTYTPEDLAGAAAAYADALITQLNKTTEL